MKIVPPFLRSIALIWNLLYNVYHVDGSVTAEEAFQNIEKIIGGYNDKH